MVHYRLRVHSFSMSGRLVCWREESCTRGMGLGQTEMEVASRRLHIGYKRVHSFLSFYWCPGVAKLSNLIENCTSGHGTVIQTVSVTKYRKISERIYRSSAAATDCHWSKYPSASGPSVFGETSGGATPGVPQDRSSAEQPVLTSLMAS